MCDLVIFLDEIKLLRHSLVVFELLLADFEQLFDDVLASLVDFSILEDVAEPLEYGVYPSWCDVLEDLPTFSHEVAGELY